MKQLFFLLLLIPAILFADVKNIGGVSVKRAHGKLIGANESADTLVITTADVYHKYHYTIEAAGDEVHNMTYTVAEDRLTINTGYDGHYLVLVSATISTDDADRLVHLAVGKNGSIGAYALCAGESKFSGVKFVLSFNNMPALVAGDYLEVYLKSDTNGDVISIYHLNMSLIYID